MSSIRILPQEIINQIAAGEVVERPSSVVKELIENSLDSAATEITVEIKDGGLSQIVISDNGQGMDEADLNLAIQAHATSKLTAVEDLHELSTMGFRGEALASISSVSRFTIASKTSHGISGIQLTLNDGKFNSETIPAVQGTTVTVADLFYNVPARRKFLKKSETEYLHILDLFISFAMFHTGVTWKLTHNDNLIYQVHKTDDWSERVGQLLGREVIKDLIPLNVESSTSLVGFIGKPILAKPNRKSQFLYVNGRLVNDFTTAKAVSQGYDDSLNQGQNPFFVINIKINPADVDVNVHPRKTEVRFANPSELFRQVQSAVRGTLNANNVLNASTIKQDVQPNAYHPVNREGFIFEPDSMNTSSNFTQSRNSDYQGAFRNLNFAKSIASVGYQQSEQERLGDWRLIGQIHKSYLLVENDAGFLVIDQHAAAERINYERLKRDLQSTTPHSQKLLLPQKIELSVRQVQMINNVKDVLVNLGFDLEFFGGSTILINSVPHITAHAEPVQLVKGILEDLDNEDSAHLHSFEEKQERALKYAACRGAIMFQDKLEPEEQLTLLKQIKELPLDKQTCCHGRPFMKQFLKSDLEKLFHRL